MDALETNAFCRKPVEMGSGSKARAIASEAIGTESVDRDQQKVVATKDPCRHWPVRTVRHEQIHSRSDQKRDRYEETQGPPRSARA